MTKEKEKYFICNLYYNLKDYDMKFHSMQHGRKSFQFKALTLDEALEYTRNVLFLRQIEFLEAYITDIEYTGLNFDIVTIKYL